MAASYSIYLELYIDDVYHSRIDIKNYVNNTDIVDAEVLADMFFSDEVANIYYLGSQYEDSNGNEIGNPDGKTFDEIRHTRGALINIYYESPVSYYTLTVNHTDVYGSVLDTETHSIQSGTTIYPSSYVNYSMDGYEYLDVNPSNPFSISSDTTINIRYIPVCNLVIHHISNGNSNEEVIDRITNAGRVGTIIDISNYIYSNYKFNRKSVTINMVDDIEYVKVISSKDNSVLKSSTLVYEDYYPETYETYEETTGIYTFNHDSTDTSSTITSLRLTQNPTNVYIYYDVTTGATEPTQGRLVVDTNLSSLTGITSVDNFIGYSLTKGETSELGTTQGTINRPSNGWYNLTPNGTDTSYSNPTIIYANVRTLAFSYTDKNGNVYTGSTIKFISKDGTEINITQLN